MMLSLWSFTGGQHLGEGCLKAGLEVRIRDHQHRLFILGMQNDTLLTASIQLSNQIAWCYTKDAYLPTQTVL